MNTIEAIRALQALNEVTYSKEAPIKTGKAYKVFRVKDGKLYPPMVSNVGGGDTPIGVWLDAEVGELAGVSKTGRSQVKSTSGGTLALRSGWHLGEIPRAAQFDRTATWVEVEKPADNNYKILKTLNSITNKATEKHNGEVYLVKENNKFYKITTDGNPFFPYDFVWGECDYAMDIDYQPEADEQGYMRTKVDDEGNIITTRSNKYQHSLAGLKKLPSKGYYKYRTNPNPDTVPWVITGQIKVNRLLSDDEVNAILKKEGIAPIHRQGGDKTLKELGLD